MHHDLQDQTYTVKEVQELLRVSRGTLYNLRQDRSKNFPKPLPLGIKGLRFDRGEIDAYRQYGPVWQVKRLLA